MRGDGRASKLLERVRRRVGEELSMPPRRCEEHYRHELKYLISYGQKADLTCVWLRCLNRTAMRVAAAI